MSEPTCYEEDCGPFNERDEFEAIRQAIADDDPIDNRCIRRDELRRLMEAYDSLSDRLVAGLNYANGRWYEWGERAQETYRLLMGESKPDTRCPGCGREGCNGICANDPGLNLNFGEDLPA